MRTSLSALRKTPTRAEADQKFLNRMLDHDLSNESCEMIRKIVTRYHSASFTTLNQIMGSRILPKEVLLDNYLYLMSQVKGNEQWRYEHSEQIMDVYTLVPEAKVLLREAPLVVRRKAVVAMRMGRLVAEVETLPEGSRTEDYYARPSQYLLDLGVKNWKHLDTFIEMMIDDREFELPAIDMILEKGIPTALVGGAL